MKKKYSKSKKYAKKKSILKNRFLWYSILIIFVISFFYFFFIHSRVFQVRKINIAGEGFNTEQEILEVVDPYINSKSLFFNTKSIFLVNRREIKDKLLESFLNAKEVSVTKLFTDKILIKIEDRIPVIIIGYSEDEYLLDREGLVFKIKEIDHDLPLLVLDSDVNLEDKILSISLIKKIQEIDKRLEPESFSLEKDDIVAHIGETYFMFSCQKDINQQIEDLLLVLEKQDIKIEDLEYFDLRHDKIFYKEK